MQKYFFLISLMISTVANSQDSLYSIINKVFFFDPAIEWRNSIAERFSANESFTFLKKQEWNTANIEGDSINKIFYVFSTAANLYARNAKLALVTLGYESNADSTDFKSAFATYIFDKAIDATIFFDQVLNEAIKVNNNIRSSEDNVLRQTSFGFAYSRLDRKFAVAVEKGLAQTGDFVGKYLVGLSIQCYL